MAPPLRARAPSPRPSPRISACRISIPGCSTARSGGRCALNGGDPDNEADALAACAFPDALLADPELRSEASGGLASRVSVHPAVRRALFDRQRAFAMQPGGAVLDGRDIGTVIAPEAEVKLFVIASVPARAERRFREMRDAGRDVTLAEIAADLEARDRRDATRAAAPLVQAEDAIVFDTSLLSPAEAIARAIAFVELKSSPRVKDFAISDNPLVQAQLDRLGALSLPQGRFGLETITALLARLGDPQRRIPPAFHVAGTNGKGSTCAYLRAMLEARGAHRPRRDQAASGAL